MAKNRFIAEVTFNWTLCSFCKSPEEAAAHLFSACSFSQSIWSQTHKLEVFFLNHSTSPNILPQSAIHGFMEEIQDQHNVIINHVLLIYKHHVYLSRNYGSLNFIGLQKYIFETNILE